MILYGAGNLGKMTKEFFDFLQIPISYVIDETYTPSPNKLWNGLRVLKPENIKEGDKSTHTIVVCITTVPIIPFGEKLLKQGWKDVRYAYDAMQAYKEKHPLNNGWIVNRFSATDKKNIRLLFSLLREERSKIHYLQFLAWHRARVEIVSGKAEVKNENRFFIPQVVRRFKDQEVFLDCGAHKGFVVDKFLKQVNRKYNKIHCFEPDNKNLKILLKDFAKIQNISFHDFALGNKNDLVRFQGGFDYASRPDNRSKAKVAIKKLDTLHLKPTFIKMHLEGSELAALKGAMKTIKESRPILAVTVYHNSDGIWKTPLFLIKNLKNYSHLLRMHTWAGTGVVMYCIPN